MPELSNEVADLPVGTSPTQLQNRDTSVRRLVSARWFPFLLLGLATLVVWGQTARFAFVWDDKYFIKELPVLRSWARFPEIFYRLDAQSTLPQGFLLFRPVRTAMYALLYHLGGHEVPQSWIYHLANVLWHGAAAMMLFVVLLRLVPQLQPQRTQNQVRWLALLVSLAFAVHPVVSEVVCWAKSLDDILATFFVLAALYQLLPSSQSVSAAAPEADRAQFSFFSFSAVHWRAWLFFLLAVYSKESAVPFAVVPLVVFRLVYRLPWKQCFVRSIPFLIITAVYVLNRHFVIGRTSQTSPISGTYIQTLVDTLAVAPKYFRLVWGIPPFCIDYTYMTGGYSWHSLPVLLGCAFLVALAGLGFVGYRKRGLNLLFFGLFWAGIFLLPVSNLIPMMQYMAERFLYLPLIGWLIALAAIIPARKQVVAGSLALISIWAVTAWNRSWIWQDEIALFVRSSIDAPKTPRIRENAVAAILHLNAVSKCLDLSTASSNQNTSISEAERKEALDALEMGSQLFPDEPRLLNSYGVCLTGGGQLEKALPVFEKAVQLAPHNLQFLVNLARARVDAGQLSQAHATLQQALVVNPDDVDLLQVQLKCLWLQEDYASARAVLLQLHRLAPSPDNDYWLSEVEKKLAESNAKQTPGK